MDKPTIGRIVHYVLHAGQGAHNEGKHRPAIIVDVGLGDLVDLQVFPNGRKDKLQLCFAEDVGHADAAESKPNTWHWPERF